MRRHLALAIVVAMLAFGALQWVAATGSEPAWRTAEPQVGDTGRYSIERVGPPEPDDNTRFVSLTFERLSPRWVHGTDGQPFLADTMSEFQTWDFRGFQPVFWQESYDNPEHLDAGAVYGKWGEGLVFGVTSRGATVSIGTFGGSPPGTLVEDVQFQFEEDFGRCGLRHNLHTNDEPWFGGNCPAMQYQGTEQIQGTTARVYGDELGNQAWYVSGLSVPIQIADPYRAQWVDIYRLEEFAPGSSTDLEPEPIAPLPEATLAPTTKGVPREDVGTAFPLQEALAALAAHPDAAAQAAFLERPDSFVESAQLTHYEEEQFLVHTWDVELTNGQSRHAFSISHEEPRPGNPLPFDPINPDIHKGEYRLEVGTPSARAMPRVDQIPQEMATPASAARLAPGDAYDAWGFEHRCDDSCQQVDSMVFAGLNTLHSNYNRYGHVDAGLTDENVVQTYEGRLYRVTAEGDFAGFAEVAQEYRTHRYEVGQLLAPQPESGGNQAQGFGSQSAPVLFGSAGVAATAGVLVYVIAAARSGAFAGLFSRIATNNLTHHPVRAAMLEAMDAEPGLSVSRLRRRLDRPSGVIQHHLRKLTDGGLVVTASNGHTTSCYRKGAVDHQLAQAGPVLQSKATRRILAAIGPGATVGDVARKVRLSQATASHHLRRLREAGLIDSRREGRQTWSTLTSLGQQALGLQAA